MAKIPANLHDVKEIEVLPSNVYSIRITSAKLVQSREKKTPGIELNGVYLDEGTEISPGHPRKFYDTLWQSREMGFATFKVKEACEACSVPFDDTGFDSDDFVNSECKVAVGQEPYTSRDGEEKIRNVIEHYLKP